MPVTHQELFFIHIPLVAVLLGILLYEIRTGLIPDLITMPMVIYFVIVSSYFGPHPWWHYPLGCMLTVVFFALMVSAFESVFKRQGLGFGAIKLMGAIGAALGITKVAVVAAILLVALILLAPVGFLKRKSLPSSPIILLAVLSVLIYDWAFA